MPTATRFPSGEIEGKIYCPGSPNVASAFPLRSTQVNTLSVPVPAGAYTNTPLSETLNAPACTNLSY